MTTWLTYREAAKKVRRDVRTVYRWRRAGMPMAWAVVDGERLRVVDEEVLLAWWRERMKADPVHQQKLRKHREGIQG